MNREKFEKVWRASESVKEVCKELGITEQSAYYWARKFDLPKFCGIDLETTPTQEEIAARSAEVRSWWSPSETERRYVGPKRVSYEIPAYKAARSAAAKYPVFVGEN